VRTQGEARQKISEDRKTEHNIEGKDQIAARQERGRHDEQDSRQIEEQQSITKTVAASGVRLVQPPEPFLKLHIGARQRLRRFSGAADQSLAYARALFRRG
jgi:hypothetical protein